MPENIYRYRVKEMISGEVEERLILGNSPEETEQYAVKSYVDFEEDGIRESFKVKKCECVGQAIEYLPANDADIRFAYVGD
jgi:hypothetical protein